MCLPLIVGVLLQFLSEPLPFRVMVARGRRNFTYGAFSYDLFISTQIDWFRFRLFHGYLGLRGIPRSLARGRAAAPLGSIRRSVSIGSISITYWCSSRGNAGSDELMEYDSLSFWLQDGKRARGPGIIFSGEHAPRSFNLPKVENIRLALPYLQDALSNLTRKTRRLWGKKLVGCSQPLLV